MEENYTPVNSEATEEKLSKTWSFTEKNNKHTTYPPLLFRVRDSATRLNLERLLSLTDREPTSTLTTFML